MPRYRRKPAEKQQQESLQAGERTDKLKPSENYYHPGQNKVMSHRKKQDVLKRWTEYCSELHTHNNNRRSQGVRCPSTVAVKSPKKGKSAGMDNIPSELVQAGGEAMIGMLLIICNKIWQTGEWPTSWTQSLIITLPKKGNLQLCQNYRTISLISHPSKVMLRILLNRLKPKLRRSSKKNRQASEEEGAQLSKISILEYSVRNTCNTSKAFTMSSWTSRRRSTKFGVQLCGQP